MSDDNQKKTWLDKVSDLLSREPKNKEQLMEILRDAHQRELLSDEMLSMIESVLKVSEMQVREAMIPRSQMVVVDKEDTLEELLPIVIESGHSRFPVTESDSNEVIGTILAKDLLKYCFSNDANSFDMNDVLRQATFVPQSKRLDVLLKEFRINRNHMAIVIDEYGHVSGLITIEDVLEQIVGDIEDEYDIDEEDNIKELSNDTHTVKAMTAIEDFNDFFNTNFSNDEFDTIGGLVLKGFGRLPKRGDKLQIEDYAFKVLHSDNRRIHLLEVKKVPTE